MKRSWMAWIVVGLLGGLLVWTGSLQALELDFLALRQALYPTPDRINSGLALVTWDERTARQVAETFGNRHVTGRLHGYAAIFFKHSQANRVLFDMDLASGRDVDPFMAQQLRGSRLFAFSVPFHQGKSVAAPEPADARAILSSSAVVVEHGERLNPIARGWVPGEMPVPLLKETGLPVCVSADTFPMKRASTLRRWLPVVRAGERYYPSRALCLVVPPGEPVHVLSDGRLRWSGGQADLGPGSVPVVKWNGHRRHPLAIAYPEYSYWDVVVSGMVLACRDRPELPECRSVPLPKAPPLQPALFDGYSVVVGTPASYVVINEADNLLYDDFIYRAPAWLNGLAALFILALGGLILGYYRPVGLASAVILLLLLGYFMVTYHAYARLSLWLYFAGPAMALVLLTLGVLGSRWWQVRPGASRS